MGNRNLKWAHEIVSHYTVRGYVLDNPSMKDGPPISNEYLAHLLEDIREIRLSERKVYQKVMDIYATAIDYDKTVLRTWWIFATVQNKMHRNVNGLTTAQIIFSRVNAVKEHMGLMSWSALPNGRETEGKHAS